MIRITLFRSNRSQTVRLPKEWRFRKGSRGVVVLRDGPRRVIVPANAVWDDVLRGFQDRLAGARAARHAGARELGYLR